MEFLFSAYMVIWLMLSAYMFSLHKKQKKLIETIERIKKKLEAGTL